VTQRRVGDPEKIQDHQPTGGPADFPECSQRCQDRQPEQHDFHLRRPGTLEREKQDHTGQIKPHPEAEVARRNRPPARPSRRQTRTAATAITVSSADRTGPKNQCGGVHDGYRGPAFQSPRPRLVNHPPTPATAKQSASNPTRPRTSRAGVPRDCLPRGGALIIIRERHRFRPRRTKQLQGRGIVRSPCRRVSSRIARPECTRIILDRYASRWKNPGRRFR
jgi:hypothetical protein